MTGQVRRLYLLAALGLLATTLAAFVIIWPLNGAPFDDWYYFYNGYAGEWRMLGTDRQFGLGQSNLFEMFFPGNAPSRAVLHALNTFATSLILFHIVRRLKPGSGWFGLVFAIVYLLYIPSNYDQARVLFSAPTYTWVTLMSVASVALLLEAILRPDRLSWGLAVLGTGFGFMASRAYESTMPILAAAPILVIFLPKPFTRRNIMTVLVWWSGLGLAVLRFITVGLPQINSGYHGVLLSDKPTFSIQRILHELGSFYTQSFPVGTALSSDVNYFPPAGLVAVLVCCLLLLFWRRHPRERVLPTAPHLTMMALLGLFFTGLAGLTFAYVGFGHQVVDRINFYAAPGQALVVVSVFGLIGLALLRFLQVRPLISVLALMAFYTATATHWYYEAQLYASDIDEDFRSFGESLQVYKEIVSLAPHLADDTLLLFYCPDTAYTPYVMHPTQTLGTVYLYGSAQIATPDYLDFEAEGVWRRGWITLEGEAAYYTYSQIVGIECVNDQRLQIMDYLPPDLMPDGLDVSSYYNPYARIGEGFLPAQRTHIFSWD